MKKNVAFGILIILFALTSCGRDEDSLQKIDQIFNLYIKNSAGQDLLNSTKSGSYTSISMNDVNGTQDVAPVTTYSLKMTTDSVYYIEYLAGAKRITIDSISPEDRTYESEIDLRLSRPITDSTTEITTDRLKIQYHWTPSVFEVSKVFYNNELKFTKEPNVPNVVTIVK
ncbi:hypothetical protein ACM39_00435 [Chryseobacterium sp. FH2]|uniref:hypothetical protein n=1 Tax=Chryseobacterium sp. FH2 TaxID=1674291 RepID=UPI00065AC215|nr:hypothetical protein [Chryseobacterium sp. FH2]KMQ69569.1 hypothetical protein ACM39_00435 [Chryseobacterium sp. FH2]